MPLDLPLDLPLLSLLIVTAVHAGFQLVVTTLVYPAFAEVPDHQWSEHHERHSRRITPVVVVVYGLLLLAGGWVLLADRLRLVAAAVALGCAVGAAVLG